MPDLVISSLIQQTLIAATKPEACWLEMEMNITANQSRMSACPPAVGRLCGVIRPVLAMDSILVKHVPIRCGHGPHGFGCCDRPVIPCIWWMMRSTDVRMPEKTDQS